MKLPTASTEPVRVSGWTALLFGCALVAAFLWSTGADVRQIVGTLALLILTSVGGLEFARKQVWSPASLDEIASAEAALAQVNIDDVTP